MTAGGTQHIEELFRLSSRLSEMVRLSAWINELAARYGIPDNVHFAIALCLEEAVSNTILHGYRGITDRPITVRFTVPREGYFVFAVEDEAPHYNPLESPELPPLNPGEEIRVGGQGLRMLRQFADTLEYERIMSGNCLRMGFSATGSAVRRE